MLERSHPQSRRISFGTFRTAAEPPASAVPAPRRRTVLVLPEGYPEEARLLFNTAIRAARLLPDHRFILRSHPVLPFSQVEPFLEPGWRRLSHVEPSLQKGLAEDLSRSSVVFYRGSSSVLWAILHGLKPLYLQHAEGRDVDPLFELEEGWREHVRSVEQLVQALRRFAHQEEGGSWADWEQAAVYVRSYVTPVDSASVERLLEAAGIGQKEMARCIA